MLFRSQPLGFSKRYALELIGAPVIMLPMVDEVGLMLEDDNTPQPTPLPQTPVLPAAPATASDSPNPTTRVRMKPFFTARILLFQKALG